MKKDIVKIITDMSGKYSPDNIFTDWVQCSAITIQNSCCLIHDSVWHEREKTYKAVMNKYELEERQKFVEMLLLLTDAMEEQIGDILGEIYMEAGCGSKRTGQFFTPFHISELMARIQIPADISEDNPFMLQEPSVGGGGMVIAVVRDLKNRGINYQKCMKVIAQDLDWRSVYMAYVQFSLLGIDAVVVQGNTLTEPYDINTPPIHILKTPKRMGMLL